MPGTSLRDLTGHAAHPAAMARVLRSIVQVDGLLVLLAVLYLAVARDGVAQPLPYLATIAAYGVVVLALHLSRALATYPRERLMAAIGAMVLFVTCLLGFAGGERGPLLNLYLLPIITAALALGRGATVTVVALAAAGRLFLGGVVEGHDVFTLAWGLALLSEGVPVLLVALLTSSLAAGIQDATEQLHALTDRDDVTGLLNLEAFTRLVTEERERAVRRGNPFAVLLVDIEGLREVNDRYGPEAGNRALVAVAQALRRSSRNVDLVARYGGDEFVMYLCGAGPAVARAVINRVRHNVATTSLQFGGSLHRVSVTMGVGVFPADGRQLRDLLNSARRDLEKDKVSRRPPERTEARQRA